MSENKISKMAHDKMMELLEAWQNNPEKMDDNDRDNLNKLYASLCKTLGISEHSQWRVEWRVEKWFDTARKLMGLAPDEVLVEAQNVILDSGANEMLKLIAGAGGTAFSNENAYIYVGTDNTPENAAQVGVLATGSNVAYASMDSGYPAVSGRSLVYRATFDDTEANFAWNEASIANGTGGNAVFMNRKVAQMGTKAMGTWALQITVQVADVSNA